MGWTDWVVAPNWHTPPKIISRTAGGLQGVISRKFGSKPKAPVVTGTGSFAGGGGKAYNTANVVKPTTTPPKTTPTNYTPGVGSFVGGGGTAYNTDRPAFYDDWSQKVSQEIDKRDQTSALLSYLRGEDVPMPSFQAPSMPAVGVPNFADIFAQYSGKVGGAYDQLQNVINAQNLLNAQQQKDIRTQIEGRYNLAGQDYQNAVKSAQGNLANEANRMGLGQTLQGTEPTRWNEQNARIMGLMGSQKAGQLGALDMLQGALGQSGKAALEMAAAGKATGMDQLAKMLANAQVNAQISAMNRQSSTGQQSLQNAMDMYKMTYGQHKDELARRATEMRLLKSLGLYGGPGGTGSSSGTGTTATDETSQTNPGLWDAILNYPDAGVKAMLMDAYGAPNADANTAYRAIMDIRKTAPGGGTNVDYVDPDLIDMALKVLQPYASDFGGYKQTVGSKKTGKSK